jgi:hypothetical protein
MRKDNEGMNKSGMEAEGTQKIFAEMRIRMDVRKCKTQK